MNTALHHDGGLAADLSDEKIAFVADRRGDGESGNILVGDHNRILYGVGQLPQTASEDDAYSGLQVADLLLDVVGCLVDSFYSNIHGVKYF